MKEICASTCSDVRGAKAAMYSDEPRPAEKTKPEVDVGSGGGGMAGSSCLFVDGVVSFECTPTAGKKEGSGGGRTLLTASFLRQSLLVPLARSAARLAVWSVKLVERSSEFVVGVRGEPPIVCERSGAQRPGE